MRFTVTELSGPDVSAKFMPRKATPGALNDAGQVAGYRALRAALWERGRDRHLAISPGKIGKNRTPEHPSETSAVNDKGAVVGVANNKAFLWERGGRGKRFDLGTLPERGGEVIYAKPVAVNNRNEVVGDSNAFPYVSFPNDLSAAFRWRNGKIAPLPLLGMRTSVSDLNDQGVAVGWSYQAEGDQTTNQDGDACVWEGDTVTKLPTLPNAPPRVFAYGINNRGEIVGAQETGARGEGRCLIWLNRNVYDLGVGEGRAINDAGVIVGSTYAQNLTPPRPLLLVPKSRGNEGAPPLVVFAEYDKRIGKEWASYHGFPRAAVWLKGKPYLLDEMLQSRIRWGLTAAYAINNRNQILALGFRADVRPEKSPNVFLLLTPVR